MGSYVSCSTPTHPQHNLFLRDYYSFTLTAASFLCQTVHSWLEVKLPPNGRLQPYLLGKISDTVFNKRIQHWTACTDFPNIIAERHIFWGSAPPGVMTPKVELGRDLCTMHLSPKFHHPMFTRSEVIVLRNKQTHPQTHKPTNKQTNRGRRKHPTFFATLGHWVKITSTYYK